VAAIPGTRRAYRALRAAAREVRGGKALELRIGDLPLDDAVRLTFEIVLQREPRPGDLELHMPSLERGVVSRAELAQMLRSNAEIEKPGGFSVHTLGYSIHAGRGRFVRSLPAARRIVDLGGTALGDPRGALVCLGYPYDFESLVVVELPSEDRHQIYRADQVDGTVHTERGPVSYRYHSMVDLSDFDDSSVDLVYAGESLEHVPPDEGAFVLGEVLRILRPGGHFALDTPNGRVTRLQQAEFIDPDHKVEYTWPELRTMLLAAGFTITRAHGLNYAGESMARGSFDFAEVASNCGLFDAIEDCYIMACVARKPPA